MSPIRVGLSTTMIEPGAGRFDGIGVYTNALLRGLPGTGCAVQGYSYPPPLAPAPGLAVGHPMPHSFELSSLLDLLTPAARRARMAVDVFHVTDYRIVRMHNPVVATLHDAIPLKHPHWCNPRLRGLKNWVQKAAARKADHVIALSHFARGELVEWFGVDGKRITVVPCGVGAEWLEAPPEEDVRATLAANGLRPGYFLFVGTLQPRKNIERLLDAYLSLPPNTRRARQLVIVGRAGWQCASLLARIQAVRQNGEQVVWLSQLEQERQLRHVYTGAGVFVFPSLYEGYGIPLLEAFASGVPAVTSNTSSLPEVSRGAALEVDPLATGEIAAAMLAVAQDGTLRARCVAAGLARARTLTWSNTAEQTAQVYRTLLGG